MFSPIIILFPHLIYRLSCCLFFIILQELAGCATEKLNALHVLITQKHLQSIFLFNLCK